MSTTKKINRRELEQDEFIEKVFDLGEWLEANWQKAADLGGARPVGEVARYYRALALVALDKHAEATPILEEIASDGGPIAAQAKVSLANALAAKGDYDKAATLLHEVSTSTGSGFPPDAALAMLGALRARQGKNDEARKAYEDLLSRFPQSGHVPDARQRLSELPATGTLPASSSGTTR